MKMKICRRIWLERNIKKYERFLIEAGVREAAERGINFQVGLEWKAIIGSNTDPFERIYLPVDKMGRTDVSPILALGAEKHPEEARRYTVYQKMLDRL